MPPCATAERGAFTSMISCIVVNSCTQRSVATPPEYSQKHRQRKNRVRSNSCFGAGPSQRAQSMVLGDASGEMGYTHAPSGVLRYVARRTILILPSAPDLTTSRALAVMVDVLFWLPTITSLPLFFAASQSVLPSAMLSVIG